MNILVVQAQHIKKP